MIGIDACLGRIIEIPGARNVTLVDADSGLAVAAVGRHEPADEHEVAATTTDVVRAVLTCTGLASGDPSDDIDEVIICGSSGYHVMKFVDSDFGARLFVHILFDDVTGNLGMARFQLRSILAEFSPSGA